MNFLTDWFYSASITQVSSAILLLATIVCFVTAGILKHKEKMQKRKFKKMLIDRYRYNK